MNAEVNKAHVETGREIQKIVVTYGDGSTRELTKCMIVENAIEKDETCTIDMHCLGLSGRELIGYMEIIAEAFFEMAGGK